MSNPFKGTDKSTWIIVSVICMLGVLSIIFQDKVRQLRDVTGSFPTWTILLIILAVAAVWYFFIRPRSSDAQTWFNKSMGLPANWRPPQYLGAARDPNSPKKTPKGITVYTRGFDREDIPIDKEKILARVMLTRIDEIWREVRDRLSSDSDKRLTPGQKDAIKNLKDHYPMVYIEPSIWWDGGNSCYVAGLTPRQNTAQAVVWYRTVTDPKDKKNWESILQWEFCNVAFLTVGRADLAK